LFQQRNIFIMNDTKVTKEQLLKIIEKLQKNPEDKIRILGDTGITIMGAGLGAAAAGSIAGITGATSIFGLTSAAGWFGITAVSSTPVGWVIGSTIAGGALAYVITRLIHDGGLAEGRKLELLQQYRHAANEMETKERVDNINSSDKTKFILSMKELIAEDIISPEDAAELIKHVEGGKIPLSNAFCIIEKLLSEKISTDVKKAMSKEQRQEVEYLEKVHKDGFLSTEEFQKRINSILSDVVTKKNITESNFPYFMDINEISSFTTDNINQISNFTTKQTTNAVKTLNDAKDSILSNINLDKTTENISESVQEKASATLDLLKGAKKDIFNRFK
jgi:hypothetical protein